MHEMARHTLHAAETLEMATETVASMMQEHEAFSKDTPLADAGRIGESLRLQRTLLKCLLLRSQAIDKRLHNEINLVNSTVSHQQDRNTDKST
jgi:hypothetical protein